jgi:hypothetical protein
MDNFDLKKFVSSKSLLKENSPGYDTRKFGEALPTLESVKATYEANIDGTISDDEDERVEDLMAVVGMLMDDLIDKIEREAYEIGGYFRSPSITARAGELIIEKIKKSKILINRSKY